MVRRLLCLLTLLLPLEAHAICSGPSAGTVLYGFNELNWQMFVPPSNDRTRTQIIDHARCEELDCVHTVAGAERAFDTSLLKKQFIKIAMMASVGSQLQRIIEPTILSGFDMGKTPLLSEVRIKYITDCLVPSHVATIAGLKDWGQKVIVAPGTSYNFNDPQQQGFGGRSPTAAQGVTGLEQTYGGTTAGYERAINDGKLWLKTYFDALRLKLNTAGLADRVFFYDLSNEINLLDGRSPTSDFGQKFTTALLTDTCYQGNCIKKIEFPTGKLGLSIFPICDDNGDTLSPATTKIQAVQTAAGRNFDWIDVHIYPDIDIGKPNRACRYRESASDILIPWLDTFPNSCISMGEFSYDYCKAEGFENIDKQVHQKMLTNQRTAFAHSTNFRAALAWNLFDYDSWLDTKQPIACTGKNPRHGKGYSVNLMRDAWGAYLDEDQASDGPLGVNYRNAIPGGGDFESYMLSGPTGWHTNAAGTLERITETNGGATGNSYMRATGIKAGALSAPEAGPTLVPITPRPTAATPRPSIAPTPSPVPTASPTSAPTPSPSPTPAPTGVTPSPTPRPSPSPTPRPTTVIPNFTSLCSPLFNSSGSKMAVSAYVRTSAKTNDLVLLVLNRKQNNGGTIESKQVQLTVTPGEPWRQIQGMARNAESTGGAFLFSNLPSDSALYELCFIFSSKVAGHIARLNVDAISAFGLKF